MKETTREKIGRSFFSLCTIGMLMGGFGFGLSLIYEPQITPFTTHGIVTQISHDDYLQDGNLYRLYSIELNGTTNLSIVVNYGHAAFVLDDRINVGDSIGLYGDSFIVNPDSGYYTFHKGNPIMSMALKGVGTVGIGLIGLFLILVLVYNFPWGPEPTEKKVT